MFQAKVWPASVGKVHQNEQQTKSRNRNLTQKFFFESIGTKIVKIFLKTKFYISILYFFGEIRRRIYYQQNGSFRRKIDGDQVIHSSSLKGFKISLYDRNLGIVTFSLSTTKLNRCFILPLADSNFM